MESSLTEALGFEDLELPDELQVEQVLYRSARTLVVRAVRQGRRLVVKTPRLAHLGAETALHYGREVMLRRDFSPADDCPNLEWVHGAPLLVQPDRGMRSLTDHVGRQGRLDVGDALFVGERVAEALATLHRGGWVHGDVHPGNVLWDGRSEVRLIDFEHSFSPHRSDQIKAPILHPYLAPEAIDKSDATPDERSDLYGLGATLAFALTGRPPFATTGHELNHAVLTRNPEPLARVVGLSEQLARVLERLLAKQRPARYQSAQGVLEDLRRCREAWGQVGHIPHFGLGQSDVPMEFRPPGLLVGREHERQLLSHALRKCLGGHVRGVLIAGEAGVGKSALARSIRTEAESDGAIYSEGKFDQFERLGAYRAWRVALTGVVNQLLDMPSDKRALVEREIEAALGEAASSWVQLVPALAELIGARAPPSPASDEQARNRIDYGFGRLITAFERLGVALVLVLDDLQWADQASMRLLQLLLSRQSPGRVLIMGTYRTGEVSPEHPVRQLEESVLPDRLDKLQLAPLTPVELAELIAAALPIVRERAVSLAEVVFEKTEGNPFFTNQLLMSLFERRLVRFDSATGQMTWDHAELAELAVSTNVVDVVVERIRAFDPDTQRLLSRAATLGARFELATLAWLVGMSDDEAGALLEPAREAHLVEASGGSFRFTHDKAQQASYQLVPEKEQQGLHLHVGCRLAAQTKGLEGRRLQRTVEHLNRAADLIVDGVGLPPEAERLGIDRGWLLRHNQLAGKMAAVTGAHRTAVQFFEQAHALQPVDAWQHQQREALPLALDLMSSLFVLGEHEKAGRLLEEASEHVTEALERARLHQMRIKLLIARNDQHGAIDEALQALALLDVDLRMDSESRDRRVAELRVRLARPLDQIDALEDLPPLDSARLSVALEVLAGVAGAAYVMRPKLWELVTLQMADISVTRGASPFAPFAFGFYGVLLCGVYDEVDAGYLYGRLALRLTEKLELPQLQAKVINLFDVFIRHWKEHLRESVHSLPRGVQSGLEYGDFEYGSYNAIQRGKHQVLCGDPLAEVFRAKTKPAN